MESSLGDLIHPDGWYNKNNYAIDTVTFGEYENRGPGAGTNNRVNWEGYRPALFPDELYI
jgi:pectinesterase